MKHIKLYEFWLAEKTMTAKEIAKYIQELTPLDSDQPDFFIDQIKKSGKSFELQTLKIQDILSKDKYVEEYVKSGEDRYGEDYYSDEFQPSEDDLEQPIVIFDGKVMDGYSRISTLYHRGETKIKAWITK